MKGIAAPAAAGGWPRRIEVGIKITRVIGGSSRSTSRGMKRGSEHVRRYKRVSHGLDVIGNDPAGREFQRPSAHSHPELGTTEIRPLPPGDGLVV